MFLYICVFVVVFFLLLFSQKNNYTDNELKVITSKPLFITAWGILLFFACFTDIGTDRMEYVRIANYASFEHLFYCDFGLNIVFIFLKYICQNNIDAVLALTTFLSTCVFAKSFWNLREKINLGFAVLGYCLILFLRFYLVSMYASVAFVFLSVSYMICGKKSGTVVCYAVACTLHYSATLLAPCYILYFLLSKNKGKQLSKAKVLMIIVGYICSLFMVTTVYNFLVNNFAIFSAYKMYGVMSNYSGTGITRYVIFLPVFYFLYQSFNKKLQGDFVNIFLVIALSGYVFYLIGFQFNVFSRVNYFFDTLYMFFLPMYIVQTSDCGIKLLNGSKITYDKIICYAYVIFLGIMTFLPIVAANSTTGMQEWHFFMPFK